MTRFATVTRSTRETDVEIALGLDGTGAADVTTGIGFLDHLLTSMAHHALFDVMVRAEGDLHVDDHHCVEDTFLVLGAAFDQAVADRSGIARFGDATIPMDEARALASVDIVGRPYAMIDLPFRQPAIGGLSTQNIGHGLEAFTRTAAVTLHLTAQGLNDHHIAEAAFKALARALRQSVAVDPRQTGIPSTKGTT